jgi:outer membrane protein TolC
VFLAEKGYELGVKTHLEMQDAELNLLTAKSNLARAARLPRRARDAGVGGRHAADGRAGTVSRHPLLLQ